MEHDKINNLLLSEDNENAMSKQLSKFVTRKDIGVKRLSNTYNENK